jgi:hypothetical protein
MAMSSASVSGEEDVRDGVGRVYVGKEMLRREERPGIEEMVAVLKDVQGRICRTSHQKCLEVVSRTWMFNCRTRAGAGLGEVR